MFHFVSDLLLAGSFAGIYQITTFAELWINKLSNFNILFRKVADDELHLSFVAAG